MVLHTKSRQEKAAARFLFAAGLPFYLPLLDRVNIIRGRKVVSQVPLFPSYIFLSGDLTDGYAAISTKRVCRILEIADQEHFLNELTQIDDALSRGATVYHCPFALIGTRCRVVSGPFEGIEGVVCSKLGHNRLALQIRTLGQGAVLEIDADLLEPV
jgi:transcription antitermination factor NusG